MADTATAPAAAASAGTSAHTPDIAALITQSAKRTRYIFSASDIDTIPSLSGNTVSEEAKHARISAKLQTEYADAQSLPPALLAQQHGGSGAGAGVGVGVGVGPVRAGVKRKEGPSFPSPSSGPGADGAMVLAGPSRPGAPTSASASTLNPSLALVALRREEGFASAHGGGSLLSTALIRKKEAAARQAKPEYHPQWKLKRVISGHLGWVRCIAVEPGNKWFVTGAGDRMIKIWDLASGELKLSLTGHISTVRGLAVSPRHPYLFSAGEDKMVKCWDLETNKVIRQYHGHLSGIYSLALHPTLDVIVTAGRDASARVWDIRTKAQVHVLSGHRGTIASVVCQEADPQIITGSMDATVRLWDLAAGRSITTLTHHKKSVRALAVHPAEFTFASGSAGGRNIKTWKCPEGSLVNNMTHETIVNSLSVNADGVLFSGGDNGSLRFFDYATGIPFQSAEDIPQPGSLDAESGIFCSTFDQAGIRLLTGGADKTIKVWAEANQSTGIERAGPEAQKRCAWLAANFASKSSQPINNTFTEYYPEGSNPSLELLVAQYPEKTLPSDFLKNLQQTLASVGPDIDIKADGGYGKAGGRTGSYGPLGSLPAFCRFGGNLPTSALTAVLFEVWLPLASDPSIQLAALNSSDYPTDSTPIVLGADGTIIKGPPYLLQMQANGTLPADGSSPSTKKELPLSTLTTTDPASAPHPSLPAGALDGTTPTSGTPPSRRLHKHHKKAKVHHKKHGDHHSAEVISGDDVFGTTKDFDGWNGRLLFIGNGGQRGFVPLTDLKQAMSRHRFAVAGSNAGHFSTSGGTAWALGPQGADAARDWSSRAVHVARQASLEVIDLFYGSTAGARVKGDPNPSKLSPDCLRSYYAGCSVGGMQGFGSVQNYPEDFDGVLVGAPAIYFNRVNHGQIHTRGIHRKKIAGAGFFDIKLLITSVRDLVLEQCDALDGLKDGVINEAYTCKPDFDPLLCGSTSKWGKDATACFNSTQLANLKELFQPTVYNNTFVYDRYLPGLDIQAASLTGAAAKAIGWITNAVLQNQTAPGFDGYKETLEIFQKGEDLNLGGSNVDKPDISAFLNGGKRKLIHYHGLGMGHCRNGPGAFLFGAPTQNDAGNTPLRWDTEHDIILSLVAWTERGSQYAPAYQVGASYNSRRRFIPVNPALDTTTSSGASDSAALPTTFWSREIGLRHTRKLCPWPQVAHYDGHGPTDGPAAFQSFVCQDP
ncbi:unnamed protein product [Tilletia controversa]|uniref:Carboxylic ester hydrolase n=1 Tax=Tilletia controversa TaxID=13291 RepID=A0A8X7SY23_9BASI|nr:hypothetical protein CF335_g3277 [Tilletia laevis]KAE8251044.1 hypothetical protein A4X06_0g2832 [Tilletia controversa]CAD6900775.1 unnamed protein product [Tilletia controversa]CAD6902902.1 unnamed protein product [Tilletia controversa]